MIILYGGPRNVLVLITSMMICKEKCIHINPRIRVGISSGPGRGLLWLTNMLVCLDRCYGCIL